MVTGCFSLHDLTSIGCSSMTTVLCLPHHALAQSSHMDLASAIPALCQSKLLPRFCLVLCAAVLIHHCLQSLAVECITVENISACA